jgi:hypothetical protein
MTFYYRTEYNLGRRGQVSRCYTGAQAFVAIFFDLIFGLGFEFVSALIRLASLFVVTAIKLTMVLFTHAWKLLVAAMTVIIYFLTLPLALLHEGADWLRSRGATARREARERHPLKREWRFAREL